MTSSRSTVLDLCVMQAGGDLSAVPKGARVAGFIVAWAMASRDAGRPIRLDPDFLAYWGKGYQWRTAYRHLEQFRQLFPGHDDPQRIADALLQASRDRDPSLLTAVAV